MKEILKRILGYFGRKKHKGPSLLGMETSHHKDIPDAEEIKKAVKESKDVISKKINKKNNKLLMFY